MDIDTSTRTFGYLMYGIPAVVTYGIYGYLRRRRDRASRATWQENLQAGMTEPPSLHPIIDEDACLCAGACVTACPELAIGIIAGKAVLVNPAHCIGHGACLPACPVDAIKLVFGTEKRGIDIPEVSPTFESNVPGIYIAGELGGMGLIRKAAEQGKQAIESLSKGRKPPSAGEMDVVIVGAGPAGIGAGLAAIQAKLEYVILEQEDSLGGTVYHYPRNKIAMTSPVNLPIIGKMQFKEVSKETLLAFWQRVMGDTGLRVRFRTRMEGIERQPDGSFVVRTNEGEIRTRKILLAIGRRGTPRKLDVPGENNPKVVYRLIDPSQYAGQHVTVVGGGDSALEAAIALAGESGTTVTLSYRSAAFSRVKEKNRQLLKELSEAGKVRVALNSQILSIHPDHLELKTPEGVETLKNEALLVCAGGILPTALLNEVGIRFATHRGEVS